MKMLILLSISSHLQVTQIVDYYTRKFDISYPDEYKYSRASARGTFTHCDTESKLFL